MKHSFSKAQSLALLGIFFFLASCSSRRAGFLESNPFEKHREIPLFQAARNDSRPALRVVFTGNVNGYLGPCGCSVDPKGGADRRYNALTKLRQEFVSQGYTEDRFLVLDAGNALFETKRIDASRRSSEAAKARLFQKAQSLLKIRVQNVGQNDLALGYNFLTTDPHFGQYISTNIVKSTGEPAFQTELYLPKIKTLILGLTESSESLPDGLKALDPKVLLHKKLSGLEAGTLVIVLSDLGQKADLELAEQTAFPLLIVGAREPSSLEIPVLVGKSILVQNQIQGQQWGVMDVAPSNSWAQGWYSSELGQRFFNRWNELAVEEKAKSQIKNSEEKDYEFDKLSAVALDLKKYAPGDIKQKNLYNYLLLDMTEKFQGPNPLSKLLKDLHVQKSNSHLSPTKITKSASRK